MAPLEAINIENSSKIFDEFSFQNFWIIMLEVQSFFQIKQTYQLLESDKIEMERKDKQDIQNKSNKLRIFNKLC